MFFTKSTIILALLPVTLAATCNSSNALAYTPTSSGNSGGGSSSDSSSGIEAKFSTCNQGCYADVATIGTCVIKCLNNACSSLCALNPSSGCQTSCTNDVCSYLYGSKSSSQNEDKLRACYKIQSRSEIVARGDSESLESRAFVLTCTSSQTCYVEANGNLFCLNKSTGDYTDISGGHGNVNSNTYTSASANVGSSATATTATTGTARVTATSANAASATTSRAANAGIANFRADTALGAMGLALGFMI